MNKETFLLAVRQRLQGLPVLDIERSLEYYSEMIDDHVEEGLTQEQAVAAMGSVEAVAAQILAAVPPQPAAGNPRSDRLWKWWEILLLILGAPVWLPLMLAAAVVVLALYVVLWSVVVSLYSVVIGIGAAAVACLAAGVVQALLGYGAPALLLFGAALLCAGLTIAICLAVNMVARGAMWCTKWPFKRFRRKEAAV